MPFNLVINSNNSVTNTNFKYKFLQGSFEIDGDEEDEDKQAQMCISSATIPYSWYSVNSGLYNNNFLNYYWYGTSNSWNYVGYVYNNNLLLMGITGNTPILNENIISSGTDVPANSLITTINNAPNTYKTAYYTLSNSLTNTPVANNYVGYLKAYSGTNGVFQIDPPTTIATNTIMKCSAFNDINNSNYVSNSVGSLLQNASYTFVSYSTTGFVGSTLTSLYVTSTTDAVVGRYAINTSITDANSKISNVNTTTNILTINNTTTTTPSLTLNNYVIFPSQPTLIYYISSTGTYSSSLYNDNVNINGTFTTGKATSSQNVTNNSITFTGNLPTNSVVNTINILPISTTSFYVYPAITLATNTFLNNVGNQQPYITAQVSTNQYTMANTSLIVPTPTTFNGYIINSGGSAGAYTATIVSTSLTGKSVNNFITTTGTSAPTTISSISGTYTNQFNIISQNAITNTTASGTITGVPITATTILYVSSTITPSVGNMLLSTGWGGNFASTNGTITLVNTTTLYIVTSGLTPFASAGFTYYNPNCFILSSSQIAIDCTQSSNIATNQIFYGNPTAGFLSLNNAYISGITSHIATTATASQTPDTGTSYTCFYPSTTSVTFLYNTSMPSASSIVLYKSGSLNPITPTSLSNYTYTISASAGATATTSQGSYIVWFPSTTTIQFVSTTTPPAGIYFLSGTGVTLGTNTNNQTTQLMTISGLLTASTAQIGTTQGAIVSYSGAYYYVFNPATTTSPISGYFMVSSLSPQARTNRYGTSFGLYYSISIGSASPSASTNRFPSTYYCYTPVANTIYLGTTTAPSGATTSDVCFYFTGSGIEGSLYSSYTANSSTSEYYITTSNSTFTASGPLSNNFLSATYTNVTTFVCNNTTAPLTANLFIAVGSSGGYTSSQIITASSFSPYTITCTLPISGTIGTTIRFYTPRNGGTNTFGLYATTSFSNYPAVTINAYASTNSVTAYTNQVNNISFVNPQAISIMPTSSVSVYSNTITDTFTPNSSLGLYPSFPITIYPPQSFTTYTGKTYSNSGGSYNTLTIPDGNYTISQLNTAFQTYMISKNQYLTQTSTGNKLFFINLIYDTTNYLSYFSLSPIPTSSSIPAGYTAPANFPFATTTSYTPTITIPFFSQYGIGRLIGFLAGTYPTTLNNTTTQTIYGTLIPNNPVTSIVIRCNLISNSVSNQTDILDVIPIANTSFGDDIIYQPSFEKWIALKNGVYDGFFIYIQDQNFKDIPALDPNSLFSLLIKNSKRIKKQKNSIVEQTKQLSYNLFSNENV
jgi:hypothetical protein